ncbi:MAG: adenylate/guanylate cyclase domain-containing protein, partial [Saprospiraceae bacterium]
MKHLIPHFIAEKNNQGETWRKFQGFTLFLDMSGFTNLTQHLMKEEGNEGAEMMSQILNDLFAPLVNIVYRKGGFIPYFAGDAFTSIFIDDDNVIPAEELADTAKEIQRIYSGKNFVYNDKEFPIHLKIGLSYGEIEWGIIGKDHKSFYFKGEAIDACAFAEQKAKAGDVIVDMNFIEQCTNPTSIFTCEKIMEDYFKVVNTDPGKSLKFQATSPIIKEEDIQGFFPDAIIHYNDIGEFREAVSVFISFKGIENKDIFHEFATIISEQFANFSGYFKEIDFGDKGGVIVGFFGVPLTYGDNVERALRFVSSLSKELAVVQKKSPLEYKVGITAGMAFAGIIGGKERCQYAVVGNNVNLAARLMVYANWGDVLVSSEIGKEKGFQFKQKGDIQYKGIEGLISTYKFIGEAENQSFYSGEMIGRNKEMNALLQFTEPILDNTFAGVGVIFGEAGIGKSRLAYEVKDKLSEQGAFNWYTCQADQILRKPFNPFIYHFKNYFQQSPDRSDEENVQFFEKVFQYLIYQCGEISSYKPELVEIIRNLKRTKTIIAARLGLYYKDSLWNQLDAKGRYQNTISAFINLLQAEASIQPYVIEVEDGHWFDESTKALLSEMVKSLNQYPVCILIT